MKRFDLTVEPRQTGKHTSRSLRNNKQVPGIVYGSGENANLTLHVNDVKKYNTRAYENALFNLKSSDAKVNGKVVLMKQVDVHPLSRNPVHVDLFAIDLKKAVRVSVEILFEGKAIGLAEGGLLNIVRRDVEVECLPTDIPENFKADVTELGLGMALHVSDLKLPAGMKLITHGTETIAVVNLQEEEVAAPVVAAAPAAAAPAKGAPAAKAAAAPAKAPAKK